MNIDTSSLSLLEKYRWIEKSIDIFQSTHSIDKVFRQLTIEHPASLFRSWAKINVDDFFYAIHPATIKRYFNPEIIELFDSNPHSLHQNHFTNFVHIIPMEEDESRNKFEHLAIQYQFIGTIFGLTLIAATQKGICYLAFEDCVEMGLKKLHENYPNAQITCEKNILFDAIQPDLSFVNSAGKIHLHLHGTPFQLLVWQELLKIPFGKLTNYHQLAVSLGRPSAARAVGTAVGQNQVAYLIPCHRVIRSVGEIGKFKWGNLRKIAIIGWEQSYLISNQ